MSWFTAASVHPPRILSGAITVAAANHAGNAFTFDPNAHGIPAFEFSRFSFRGAGSISFNYLTNITDPNFTLNAELPPGCFGRRDYL